jgi:2-polyprenyl-3-methyl-5-hydroxy-6-metoxy-1,4-benzoquinol methylase
MSYQEQLEQEGRIWGEAFRQLAQETPPEWAYYRQRLEYLYTHRPAIDALLASVRPGMNALELGCGSGWLTLALAQAGADALGLDISEQALAVGQAYYERIRERVRGQVRYQVADLNTLRLPAAAYDLIVIKGTLHHLPEAPHVIAQVKAALKPDGRVWIHDSQGDEHPRSVLLASALMFLLPTHVSYAEKLRGLWRFRRNATERIRMSMQAEGLSPFEGSGRHHDWLALVQAAFPSATVTRGLSITGYLAHQLRMPRALAVPTLWLIAQVDRLLTRAGVLRSTGVTVSAQAPSS